MVFGSQYLVEGTDKCLLNSFLISSSARFEQVTVGFLAFMRYSIVCHNTTKGAKFWIITYLIVITPVVALYLYPLITIDANPTPSMLFCAAFLKPGAKTMVLAIINPLILLIPSCISTYSYFIIGIKSYKKLNRMKAEALASNDQDLVYTLQKQKISLIFQLIVVATIFNFAYMPIYITMILKSTIGYKRPPIADAIIIVIVEVSRAIDPIITLVFQPELNHELKVFLTKFKAIIRKCIVSLFQ
jgi:hypothetical protein